ncbi:MAG: hypothetical protein ACMUHX_01450 [bacterium]
MFSENKYKKLRAIRSIAAIIFLTSLLFAVVSPSIFNIDISQAMDYNRARGSKVCRSCSQTAKAAYMACLNEKRDDDWIAFGNCNNLLDLEARSECFTESRSEFWEAYKECKDQRDARLEICEELGEGPYDPKLKAEDFVDPENIGSSVTANRYFPLVSGTQWVYQGESEESTEKITVTVTGDIKEIEYPSESGLIFKCAVVLDVVELDGLVIEKTYDWYAQDMVGNVWYFGEISQEFEDGEMVSLEGSWKAGRDYAKPGILMPADPDPEKDNLYRQEFALGDAEDMGEVVNRGEESVTVPFNGGTTYDDDVLKTKDFTPLEPDIFEFKFYVPGVGVVLDVNPDTGERVELMTQTTLS